MSSITGNGTGHIYYNITLTNNDTTNSGVFPAVTFTETRNTPILNCPEDYNMSVVRFALETVTLPVMTCQPVVGSITAEQLIYEIQLSYTAYGDTPEQATYATEYVQFNPNDTTVVSPTIPITEQDLQNPYYNIFSYNSFILMINRAISDAWTTLLPSIPAAVTSVATLPYLSWDTGGNLAILSASTALFTNTAGNGIFKIAFNTPLFTLFSSFNSAKYNGPTREDPTVNQVWYSVIVDTGPSAVVSSHVVTVGSATTTLYDYQVIQEYTTCPLWTPVDSIVFTTSMLPINPELVAAPIVYNNNQVFASVGTNANLTNTLTDFVVDLVTGTEYKPTIYYVPSGEYRLTSLFGTSPASSIQVNVYYKNRFGTLVPLTLGFGCSASIKLMFRRKDFSNLIIND